MIYYADGFHNKNTYGYSVVNENNELIITEEIIKNNWKDGSNNVAEYLGVIKACEVADHGDIIISDSMLIVQQSNGKWKVKCEHLVPYCLKTKQLLKMKNIKLKWLSREKNLAGHFNEKLEKSKLHE